MIADVILLILSIVVLLAATVFDLRTKEIPDTLSYGFIGAALLIRGVFSFSLGFNYLLTDISSLLEIGESENQPKNYSFWEINFPFFSSKIYCSPSFDRKNMSKNAH